MLPILFLAIFSSSAGCEKDHAPPVYLPSGQTGIGGTGGGATDGGNDAAAPAEPEKSEIPASARAQIIISIEYVEGRVPQESPAIIFDKTPRIWIYVFWRGLEAGKLYSETVMVCPPDKAEVCEDGAVLTREFVPTNSPANPARDAVYVEPLGWMTVTGVNLRGLGTTETLGNWTISVWPAGQDGPSAEKMLTAM
jgi:hypothetical protein